MAVLILEHQRLWGAGTAILLLAGSGCSFGPSGTAPPAVDPPAAAAAAISAYDKDADSQLNEAELAECPALLAARKHYDTDGDGRLSQAEIEARLEQLYARQSSFVDARCLVTSGGRPLPGAEVVLTPVPFLAEAIQPASGITDEGGVAKLGVAADHLPENLRQMQMMQVGLYRVEVKHSSIASGEDKQFGFEVDPARRDGTSASFDMQAK